MNWNVIHSYTRAEAIRDGVLVDVTKTATEAGFQFPVALTRAVYEAYVRVPADVSGQDEDGRLWDILWMLRWAIRSAKGEHPSELPFKLYVAQAEGKQTLVELKAHCGPGDDGEPVLTVLLPDED